MCGVGIITDLNRQHDVTNNAVEIAKGVQHRGQLAFGISSLRGQCLTSINGLGRVEDVLPLHRLQEISGHSALVHTRYATSGTNHENLTQPFLHRVRSSADTFALGFNGNIANHDAICKKLAYNKRTLRNDVDTEAILQLIRFYREELYSMPEIFAQLEEDLDGAFNLAWMNELGESYVYRGVNGNKPMSYVQAGSLVAAASEDSALKRVFPTQEIKELLPGELWQVNNAEVKVTQLALRQKVARCFFEWPYFAAADSTIHGVNVRSAREEFGKQLAQSEWVSLNNAVIVPIPNSAIPVAEGYAKALNMHITPAITRTFDGRTFIAQQENREQEYAKKFVFSPELLTNKDVVLIDDSIVRGGTMQFLIKSIKELTQPNSIHIRLGCPPILAPCFYGIHFPTCKELIARKYYNAALKSGVLPKEVLQAIATDLDVDSVEFMAVEAMKNTVDANKDGLCMACVTGEYPTPVGQQLYAIQS